MEGIDNVFNGTRTRKRIAFVLKPYLSCSSRSPNALSMPRVLLLTLALSLAACSRTAPHTGVATSAADTTTQLPEDRFALNRTSAHLRILAADEMMGRDPGTPGGDAAARYIAEQFRAAGVQMVPGAEEYYQPVPLAEQRPAEVGRLMWNETTFEQGTTLLVMGGPAAEFDAEAVDAGFGTIDDVANVDVDGKIALVRFGQPNDQSLGAALRAMSDKAERLAAAGAAGIIELYQGGRPLATVIGALQSGRLSLSTGTPTIPYVWVTDAEGALLTQAEAGSLGPMQITSSGSKPSKVLEGSGDLTAMYAAYKAVILGALPMELNEQQRRRFNREEDAIIRYGDKKPS